MNKDKLFKMIEFIENKITERNYELILCPYVEDTHQDHREVSNATLSASKLIETRDVFRVPSGDLDITLN